MRSLLLNLALLDGRGAPPVADAWLVVEGERIAEVHAGPPPSGPFDATFDLGGRTCLPGLIDLHTHLCWDGSRDPVEVNAREGRELTLLRMVTHARRALERGVTTLRDVGCVDDLSLVLASAIRAGVVPGPRLVASGRTLVMTGGHDPFWGLFCDGPWAGVAGVRGQAYRGAGVIKVAATGGVYGRTEGEEVGTPELRLEELQAICQEAHRLGLRVAAHAVGRDGIDSAVAAGCDTIEHGIFAGDAALRAMAAGGQFLTPTLFIYRTIAEGAAPDYAVRKAVACARQHPDTVARARAAGVSITAGSDAGSPGAPHPALFAELRDLVTRGGLTPLEAITAATATNARALGLDGEIGTLTPGRQADLVVVDGDPATDVGALERPYAVMQAGAWVVPPAAPAREGAARSPRRAPRPGGGRPAPARRAPPATPGPATSRARTRRPGPAA
jgi:imidazolonepropionase-like amidohydrolase